MVEWEDGAEVFRRTSTFTLLGKRRLHMYCTSSPNLSFHCYRYREIPSQLIFTIAEPSGLMG